MAVTAEQVDEANRAIGRGVDETRQRLEHAAERLSLPENRERARKALAQLDTYTGAMKELVRVRKELIGLWEQRNGIAADWMKEREVMNRLPALAALASRAEVEARLRDADLVFFDARVAGWRYAATGEAEMLQRISQGSERAAGLLRQVEALAGERSVAAQIEKLMGVVTAFRGVIEATAKAANHQQAVMHERATPASAQLTTLVDEIAAIATRVSAEKTTAVDEETARAGWINLGVGLLVILILIVSTYLSGRAAERRKSEMRELADSFETAVGSIVTTVSSASTELEAAAHTLTTTAESTQQLSTSVAGASHQASSNVETVATAAEELASSVSEISRQVQESSRIATEAMAQAQTTDTRMAELSKAAARIGDVVKLITAVAEQTNLLALNATIEAARAGDAGRGFAVVASEVKALAAQTAKATEEIGTHINAMQAATGDSVADIKEIGSTITRVAQIATTISAAVEEQGAATQEIARNVQQAAQGTGQVATHIGDVARGASETGSASAQVLSSARELSNEGNRLKSEVDKFLQTVRAA